jgi:hypothetical protein
VQKRYKNYLVIPSTNKISKLEVSKLQTFLKDLTSGVSPFTRAEPGKPCVHPVNSTQDCKKAEAFFSDAAYVMLRDEGHGLPYGCISDKVTKGKHYLYWNSLGVTKSEDPNLQQICRTTTATNHGMFSYCFFYNILNPIKPRRKNYMQF